MNSNHTFKLAELKHTKDGEPRVTTYTVESFVNKVRQPEASPTLFQAYHFQKAEQKRLTLEASEANSLGNVERYKQLKADANQYKDFIDRTKMGKAVMPFIWKNDRTYKVSDNGFKQRDNAHITHFSLVMLDVESHISKDEIHAALSGYEYVLWPSISHTPDDPRFRVVLFPAQPLTTAEAEALIYRIDFHLPARNDPSKKTQAIDPASLEAGRLMYLPKWLTAHPERYADSFVHNRGQLLTATSFTLDAQGLEALSARQAKAKQHQAQSTRASVQRITASPSNHAIVIERRGTVWLNPEGTLETDEGLIVVREITGKISGVRCPLHVDTIGSEFVAINKHSGRPQLVCAKCGVFKMLPFDPKDEALADDGGAETPSTLTLVRKPSATTTPDPVAAAAEQRNARKVSELRKRSTHGSASVTLFEPDNLVRLNSRYLPDDLLDLIPAKGVTLIRSPKGTGKTELISKITAQCEAQNQSSMLLGHRVVLLKNLAERTGLDYYRDLEDGGISAQFAVCLNSLTRLRPGTDNPYHTVIIDESEQVLQALTSPTLNKIGGDLSKIFYNLQWLFHHAQRIILLDADLTAEMSIELLTEIRTPREDDKYLGIINDYQIGQGQETKLYENSGHLLVHALDAIDTGEKAFITTNSRKLATSIAAMIEDMGKKVLLVTAETNELPECVDFINDPTNECKRYDAVVASPTLSTGVSIDGNHFTRVYGIFGINPGTYQDADQALSRVRNCSNVSVYIQGHTKDMEAPDGAEIYNKLIDVERGSRMRLYNEEHPRMTQGELLWARIITSIRVMHGLWSVNKDVKFAALRESLGYTLIPVFKDDDAAKLGRSLMTQYKNAGGDRAEAVFHAEVIDEVTAAELGRKRQTSHDEYLQLERYKLAVVLGDSMTLESVRKALTQNLLMALGAVRALHITSHSDLMEADLTDRNVNKATFTASRHRTMRRDLTEWLTTSAGIDLTGIYESLKAKEDVEIPVATLAEVASAYAKRQKDFNFYFSARIKEPESPANIMKVWNATLGEHLRLPLVKKKRGPRDARVSRYYIQAETLDLFYDHLFDKEELRVTFSGGAKS
jgi:hypothetical protein